MILLERYRWFGKGKQYVQAKNALKKAGLSNKEILKGIVSMYAYSVKKSLLIQRRGYI